MFTPGRGSSEIPEDLRTASAARSYPSSNVMDDRSPSSSSGSAPDRELSEHTRDTPRVSTSSTLRPVTPETEETPSETFGEVPNTMSSPLT